MDRSMQIRGVLETCLYAGDLEAAEQFYTRVIGLEVIAHEPGRHVFFRCGAGVFLVFDPARTSAPQAAIQGASIPPHGARGPGHIAFRVPEESLPRWRVHLEQAGVPVEAEVSWPNGGRSLYLRDPAGNSVELASAGLWGLPEA